MIHEVFWVFRMKFEALSPHLCCGQQQTSSFAKPAILWQLILVIRPLSRFYRTFRITIQLYSEEFRRRLWDTKKKQIPKSNLDSMCKLRPIGRV